MKRIVLRHVTEAASQRLMIENGDIDVARDLSPDDLDTLSKAGKIKATAVLQATLMYLGLNNKNPNLAKPEVWEAMKWLIDYQGIQKNVIRTTYKVHEAFLPEGFLGADNENPYHQDVAKAKELLAKAGLSNGFTVKMDVRNDYPYSEIAQAVQANLALANIKVQLMPSDNKQTLGRYRARAHDIYIGEWSADYIDPHSNAQGFVWNPDNSDASNYKMLAWRNAWDIPQLTKETNAALAESDTAKRAQLYQKMQKEVLAKSPSVIMFQKVSQVAARPGVTGLEVGPGQRSRVVSEHQEAVSTISLADRFRAAKARRGGVRVAFALLRWIAMLVVTFTGLLAITFFIGRRIPIDPVLAILGDRASAAAYAAARVQLGLDKPLIDQFIIYARDVLHGHLGVSLLTANPVIDDIKRVFPATVELATLSTIVGILVGVLLGVLAAVKHNRLADHIARVIGLAGSSVPVFWLALMGLLLFYARFIGCRDRAASIPSTTAWSIPTPTACCSIRSWRASGMSSKTCCRISRCRRACWRFIRSRIYRA
ncbi:Dipeptide-binding ABC transporter, periplasmic substrate-binding component [Candidatus Burkholderia humilis]|nr:Dipeptide-binding ABC transporter, periplasmic substrate-binding component [Candidatus Burkholderia humilis]